MRLSFIAVTTDPQYRDLLLIRNECREGLTHDKHEIALDEQKQFRDICWPNHPVRTIIQRVGSGGPIDPLDQYGRINWKVLWYEPYLLMDEEWPIGYGLLKWDGEKYWMTIGLAKAYRGKGLSRLLIHYITEMAHREGHEVWLDVSKDNVVAWNGYLKAGYEIVVEDSPKHDQLLTVMKHVR